MYINTIYLGELWVIDLGDDDDDDETLPLDIDTRLWIHQAENEHRLISSAFAPGEPGWLPASVPVDPGTDRRSHGWSHPEKMWKVMGNDGTWFSLETGKIRKVDKFGNSKYWHRNPSSPPHWRHRNPPWKGGDFHVFWVDKKRCNDAPTMGDPMSMVGSKRFNGCGCFRSSYWQVVSAWANQSYLIMLVEGTNAKNNLVSKVKDGQSV